MCDGGVEMGIDAARYVEDCVKLRTEISQRSAGTEILKRSPDSCKASPLKGGLLERRRLDLRVFERHYRVGRLLGKGKY